jgi:hypothetical protein
MAVQEKGPRFIPAHAGNTLGQCHCNQTIFTMSVSAPRSA